MSHESDNQSHQWLAPMLALAAILIGWIASPLLDFACQPRQAPPPTKEEMDRTLRRADEFLEKNRKAREKQRRARETEKTQVEKTAKE